MKIRQGFVSNSSSSSFVLIDRSNTFDTVEIPDTGIWDSTNQGETQFGWQVREYSDYHSRINFAFLQAHAVQNDLWKEMIVKVIRDFTQAKIVEESVTKYGYIDHQSSASEGANIEMFEDEETLKQFLFGQRSVIVNGNDN